MHLSAAIHLVLTLASALVHAAIPLPPGVPRNVDEFRQKHHYKREAHACRKTFTIRASADENDDVSDEFLAGVREADNGGTLYLPKG